MDAEQVRIAYENAKELHKEGVSVTELYDLKYDYEERELYNYVNRIQHSNLRNSKRMTITLEKLKQLKERIESEFDVDLATRERTRKMAYLRGVFFSVCTQNT